MSERELGIVLFSFWSSFCLVVFLPFFYGMEAITESLMIVCGSPVADTLTEKLETMI